ncbi:MAG: protein translocase subunit SecF [Acidobacteria bacterium]|nr:protein translocase subunit SecF [Acidobacteriota bacterium]
MRIFENPNYDFIRWRWQALAASALVVLAGAIFMVTAGGLPLGIDFTGGTIVVAKFEQPVAADDVRQALGSVPGEKVIQSYGDPADNAVLIRLPQLAQEEGTGLEKDAVAVLGALNAAGLPKFEILSQEIVGPVIGRELQLKGIYATLASVVGIAIYIAFRFRPAFAIGAIAATLHDVLITLAFLAFFGYDLSLNIVAALLTITGYSVNDTIVIFDRVRENMRTMRRDSLEKIVNTAVNQTLSRTIITAGTTFLSVLALFVFGGEVLHGFAFTMLVGIISGTYSTVFIAAAIAIILGNRQGTAATAAVGGTAKVKAATARRS